MVITKGLATKIHKLKFFCQQFLKSVHILFCPIFNWSSVSGWWNWSSELIGYLCWIQSYLNKKGGTKKIEFWSTLEKCTKDGKPNQSKEQKSLNS